jgi:hypothetical protein
VSADDVEDMAALQTKIPSITLVTDLKLDALKAWGALWGSAEHPSPVTYVIGKDGIVTWRHILDARGDWPTYAALAAAL